MDHIRALLAFDAGPALLAMMNSLISLDQVSMFGRSFRSGACTMLVKPSGGLRPIVVSEVWMRLWAKSIVLTEQKRLADSLKPHQFGVNCPTGMQQIPLAIRLARAESPRDCSVLLDVTNAYGCISRTAILDAVTATGCSPLVDYFTFLYGSEIPILTRGFASASAQTGILQGDPLAPLLFCLALDPILRHTQSSMASGLVMAFLDDVTLTGPASDLDTAIPLLCAKLSSIGLRVNQSKTSILAHSSQASLPCVDFTSPPLDGVVLLGSPIGSDDFESQHCFKVAKSSITLMERLRDLPSKQARFLLLRLCVCPRLVHLARSTPPASLKQAAQAFDSALLGELSLLVNASPMPPVSAIELQSLASLPLHLGGTGLRTYSRTSHFMYLASVLEAIPRLAACSASMLALFDQLFARSSPLAEDFMSLYQSVTSTFPRVKLPQIANFNAITKLQESLLGAYDLAAFETLKAEYAALTRAECPSKKQLGFFHLRRLLSTTQLGAYAFANAIASCKLLTIRNAEFVVSLRRFLGLPHLPDSLGNLACVCGDALSELHLQVCSHTYEVSLRHNGVRDLLASMFKSKHVRVTVEPQLSVGQLRWDLKVLDFTSPGSLDFYGVAVVHPCQKLFLNDTEMKPLRAAAHTSSLKKAKYGKYLPLQPPGSTFTPLVFESFGAFDSSVVKLLSNYSRLPGPTSPPGSTWSSRTHMLFYSQALSLAVHRGSARVVLSTLAKVTQIINQASGSVASIFDSVDPALFSLSE